jgi:hypothetical protein
MFFRVIDELAPGGLSSVTHHPQSTTTALGRPLASMAT